ncbi:cytosine permease, partial [Bacillus subtilis]|uniref:cytosine permease n=1 Tax=Bacillus subtilis TaxID=1423 RepID=UPI0024AD4595
MHQQSNMLRIVDLVTFGQDLRTWKAMNFDSILIGCIHNIPTYASVGGLIAIGVSPWQVLEFIITESLILFGALAL